VRIQERISLEVTGTCYCSTSFSLPRAGYAELLQRMVLKKQALAQDPTLTHCKELATIQVRLVGRGLCCAVTRGLKSD